MSEEKFDKDAAVALLNQIMEAELAGVVRYTHYALMIFGHNRIPIVSWLRGEATTCLSHANEAGELVTHFGEHPSLKNRQPPGNSQARNQRHPARIAGGRKGWAGSLQKTIRSCSRPFGDA